MLVAPEAGTGGVFAAVSAGRRQMPCAAVAMSAVRAQAAHRAAQVALAGRRGHRVQDHRGESPAALEKGPAVQKRVQFRCLMVLTQQAAPVSRQVSTVAARWRGAAFLADAEGLPLGGTGEAHWLIRARHIPAFQGTGRVRRMVAAPLAPCTRPPGS